MDVFAIRVQDLTTTFLEIAKASGSSPAPQMRTFSELLRNGSEVRWGGGCPLCFKSRMHGLPTLHAPCLTSPSREYVCVCPSHCRPTDAFFVLFACGIVLALVALRL